MAVQTTCPNCGKAISIGSVGATQATQCPSCGTRLSAEPTGGLFGATGAIAPPPDNDPLVGALIAGRYQVVKPLGRGGFGSVYLALDNRLKDRRVALKVPRYLHDERLLKRFQIEANALAELDHPNICPVYDVGVDEGRPYLVMKFVEGRTLAAVVNRRALHPVKAVKVARTLARALQVAHDKKIVHRDLKPENIMMDAQNRLVLMDFGLAKWVDDQGAGLSLTGDIFGTPAYMAPEQADGRVSAIDHRCDIYTLGVILYELLTGQTPFQGSLARLLHQVAYEDPLPPSAHRPTLAPALDALCLRAMAKRPEDRFGSMADFTRALDDWLATTSGPERAEGPELVPDPPPSAPDPPDQALVVAKPEPLRSQWPSLDSARSGGSTLFWAALTTAAAVPLLGIAVHYVMTNHGSVRITGAEPNMEVRLDGDRIAFDRLAAPVELSVGEHELLVLRDDVRVKTEPFLVRRGLETTLDLRPAPPPGRSPNNPADAGPAPPESPASIATLPARPAVGEPWSGNGLALVLRWCPPGSFVMGSPTNEPQRDDDEAPVTVTLTGGFWIGAYEVTQDQFRRVMIASPSSFSDTGENRALVAGHDTADFPVDSVTWNEAVSFCQRFTQREREAGRLPAGWEYRLPTEAQWEYACRAGTTTATAFGPRLSSTQANFDGNYPYNGAPRGPYLGRTARVGAYQPNAWGLHDFHGNVWEWCHDAYQPSLKGGQGPVVHPSGTDARVFRGGDWLTSGAYCRSADRGQGTLEYRSNHIGFRVALVPSD